MANNINWGKVYCDMVTNSAFGADTSYTTEYIPDFSAPSCWTLIPAYTADDTTTTADTTLFTADATQK
tara:strand:- start:732 stop:935 length:204 start_codon:yes stop_codon:yes gene_type:complete